MLVPVVAIDKTKKPRNMKDHKAQRRWPELAQARGPISNNSMDIGSRERRAILEAFGTKQPFKAAAAEHTRIKLSPSGVDASIIQPSPQGAMSQSPANQQALEGSTQDMAKARGSVSNNSMDTGSLERRAVLKAFGMKHGLLHSSAAAAEPSRNKLSQSEVDASLWEALGGQPGAMPQSPANIRRSNTSFQRAFKLSQSGGDASIIPPSSPQGAMPQRYQALEGSTQDTAKRQGGPRNRISRKKVEMLRNKLRQKGYTSRGVDMRQVFYDMCSKTASYSQFAYVVKRLIRLNEDEVKSIWRLVDTDRSNNVTCDKLRRFAFNKPAADTPTPSSPEITVEVDEDDEELAEARAEAAARLIAEHEMAARLIAEHEMAALAFGREMRAAKAKAELEAALRQRLKAEMRQEMWQVGNELAALKAEHRADIEAVAAERERTAMVFGAFPYQLEEAQARAKAEAELRQRMEVAAEAEFREYSKKLQTTFASLKSKEAELVLAYQESVRWQEAHMTTNQQHGQQQELIGEHIKLLAQQLARAKAAVLAAERRGSEHKAASMASAYDREQVWLAEASEQREAAARHLNIHMSFEERIELLMQSELQETESNLALRGELYMAELASRALRAASDKMKAEDAAKSALNSELLAEQDTLKDKLTASLQTQYRLEQELRLEKELRELRNKSLESSPPDSPDRVGSPPPPPPSRKTPAKKQSRRKFSTRKPEQRQLTLTTQQQTRLEKEYGIKQMVSLTPEYQATHKGASPPRNEKASFSFANCLEKMGSNRDRREQLLAGRRPGPP